MPITSKSTRNRLDTPRDSLHLRVLRPRRDDPRAVRTQDLGVLLTAQLHLLRVGQPDVLDAVGDRRLLAVGEQQHDPDDRRRKSNRDQRATDEEADDCCRGCAHGQKPAFGPPTQHRRARYPL
jgi:hypothetical protein